MWQRLLAAISARFRRSPDRAERIETEVDRMELVASDQERRVRSLELQRRVMAREQPHG